MAEERTQTYEVAAASDRGRVRVVNEDAYGYSVESGIYVVCDGMGGAVAGEVASRVAVEVMLERFCIHKDGASATDDTWSGMNRRERLRDAIAAANHLVFSRAENDSNLHGMGTTLVALVTEGGNAWVAHVGDSRCYRLRDGRLQQWTQDHSLVDEQVRLGQMTPEEAERSPLRHVITRAVGSQSSVVPELDEAELRSGDIFLLCSDGLTREVRDEQIEQILNSIPRLEDACHQLVSAANYSGGRDNITCLLLRAK